MMGLDKIPRNAREARLIVEEQRRLTPSCNAFEECKKLSDWTFRLTDIEKIQVKALFEAARFV